jgi:hypothetical protein
VRSSKRERYTICLTICVHRKETFVSWWDKTKDAADKVKDVAKGVVAEAEIAATVYGASQGPMTAEQYQDKGYSVGQQQSQQAADNDRDTGTRDNTSTSGSK